MRYKRFIFFKTLCFLTFFLGISVIRSYASSDSNNSGTGAKPTQTSVETFSRGRTFGNDILCVETFEYSPETEFLNANNVKFYKKTLKIVKEFRIMKNHEYRSVAQWEHQFIFTYDKKTFVAAQESDKDINIKTSSSKWSIMDVKEVFSEDKMCLVSVKSVLYKGDSNYIVDGHADVFCTIMGNIGVNTDLH